MASLQILTPDRVPSPFKCRDKIPRESIIIPPRSPLNSTLSPTNVNLISGNRSPHRRPVSSILIKKRTNPGRNHVSSQQTQSLYTEYDGNPFKPRHRVQLSFERTINDPNFIRDPLDDFLPARKSRNNSLRKLYSEVVGPRKLYSEVASPRKLNAEIIKSPLNNNLDEKLLYSQSIISESTLDGSSLVFSKSTPQKDNIQVVLSPNLISNQPVPMSPNSSYKRDSTLQHQISQLFSSWDSDVNVGQKSQLVLSDLGNQQTDSIHPLSNFDNLANSLSSPISKGFDIKQRLGDLEVDQQSNNILNSSLSDNDEVKNCRCLIL